MGDSCFDLTTNNIQNNAICSSLADWLAANSLGASDIFDATGVLQNDDLVVTGSGDYANAEVTVNLPEEYYVVAEATSFVAPNGCFESSTYEECTNSIAFNAEDGGASPGAQGILAVKFIFARCGNKAGGK